MTDEVNLQAAYSALEKQQYELWKKLEETRTEMRRIGARLPKMWCSACQESHYRPVDVGSCYEKRRQRELEESR